MNECRIVVSKVNLGLKNLQKTWNSIFCCNTGVSPVATITWQLTILWWLTGTETRILLFWWLSFDVVTNVMMMMGRLTDSRWLDRNGMCLGWMCFSCWWLLLSWFEWSSPRLEQVCNGWWDDDHGDSAGCVAGRQGAGFQTSSSSSQNFTLNFTHKMHIQMQPRRSSRCSFTTNLTSSCYNQRTFSLT